MSVGFIVDDDDEDDGSGVGRQSKVYYELTRDI